MKLFVLLRIYRAYKGLKLKDLAAEIGISPRELSALEEGKKLASGQVLGQVIKWLLTEEASQKEESNGRTD